MKIFRRPTRYILALAWGVAVLGALAPAAWAEGGLQVNLDRVTFTPGPTTWANLFVSVADDRGRAVKLLRSSNFLLYEDGHPFLYEMEVRPFVVTDRQAAYVVLIDQSEDLATSLTLVREAVTGFLEDLGFRHQGAVGALAGRARLLAGPGRDLTELTAAAAELRPEAGGPLLYDGLFLGINTLAEGTDDSSGGPAGAVDQKVLVVLTEGRDEGSLFGLDAAAAALREEGVNLFVVGYGDRESPGLVSLGRVARESGGGLYFAAEPDELPVMLDRVSDRINNKYVITYQPDLIRLDGQSHRLGLLVKTAAGRCDQPAELEFFTPNMRKNQEYWPLVFVLPVLLLLWLVRRRRLG